MSKAQVSFAPENEQAINNLSHLSNFDSDWDPTAATNTTNDPSRSLQCISRVKRDMLAIYHDPPPGIFIIQDEQDLTLIHALITGSFDTPYEGGFFYFILRCPPDYPIRPPKVKFMTTGGGKVRFNPNLYKCGKVCISILGTWAGPAWSPALTISSVLISIQSLLTEKPYHNEPGFERERCMGDSRRYNEIIQHETIRVAVCGMLDNDYGLTIPKPLVEAMNQAFLQFYEYYEATIQKKIHLSGHTMQVKSELRNVIFCEGGSKILVASSEVYCEDCSGQSDPFGEQRGVFDYKNLLDRVHAINNRLTAKLNNLAVEESVETTSSSCSPADSE